MSLAKILILCSVVSIYTYRLHARAGPATQTTFCAQASVYTLLLLSITPETLTVCFSMLMRERLLYSTFLRWIRCLKQQQYHEQYAAAVMTYGISSALPR